jgi:hypothetical protein
MNPFYQIHIQKTGGTSVRNALGITRTPHETAFQIRDDIGQEAWDSAFTFTFVRNPFDRLVSNYFHRKRRKKLYGCLDFDTFARGIVDDSGPWHTDDPTMAQPMALWWDYTCTPSYVARFEHLRAEYRLICRSIGIDAPPLPHELKTQHESYQEYYTAELRDLVGYYYHEDLAKFGYSFW